MIDIVSITLYALTLFAGLSHKKEKTYKIPAFHLNTKNIEEAYHFMSNKAVNLITEIQHNHYFNFKDPDGNILMICEC